MMSSRITYSYIGYLIRTYKTVPRIHNITSPNPGIDKQAKLLTDQPSDLEEFDFEDLESDFRDLHKSHQQHLHEMETAKEREKFHIVRRKYFKEMHANFLTWHDKEQMRYLYKTDPEEWTIDRLSEGFPALPETVAKIVKTNWTKKNDTRITNHDHTVQNNWTLFKEGKMTDMSVELREHLKKFTNRSLNFTPFKTPTHDEKNVINTRSVPRCTEFSEIICDYENSKNKINIETSKQDTPGPNKHIKTKLRSNNPQKSVTLDTLKTSIEKKMSRGKAVTEDDHILLNQLKTVDTQEYHVSELKQEELAQITQSRFSNNNKNNCLITETQKNMSHLLYPEKISIPNKIRKPGCIYKLNDCFYDHNGEFLYRVPGLVS